MNLPILPVMLEYCDDAKKGTWKQSLSCGKNAGGYNQAQVEEALAVTRQGTDTNKP